MKERNQITEKKSILEKTEEIETPQGILNFLLRRNGTRFPYLTKNIYSVTDLVNCQRKSLYKQLGVEQEELLGDQSIEGMWSTVRGDLLHKMTHAYKWREIDIEYNVQLNDGKEAKLIGRLDMYDWKTKTVIDLKSTKFVKWQIKRGFLPKLEHILQVQCYGTMFSNYIPIENLNIVYVDTNDIVTYKIKNRDLSTWIKTRIQEIEEAVNNKTIIKGEPSGLCQYCRYQSRCFNDGNGIEHTPLSAPKSSDKNGS